MVEVVQDGERYTLRYMGDAPYPDFSASVHHFASTFRYLSICNPLAYCRLCYVVPYALEIMPYITFKHPTVATVRDIIPPQMCGHTV